MTDKYDDIIKKAADIYGHPFWLIRAVVEAESGGNPDAVSSCGAIGLMQIMPETGKELGLTEEELYDPKKNIMAGCEYLFRIKKWLRQPDFFHKLMLAAYNGGIGNVWEYVGIPPFEETKNYVDKVMKNKP